MTPPPEIIERLRAFLEEDIRSGDLTTNAMGDLDIVAVGTIRAKSKAVLAGVEEIIAIAGLTGLDCDVLVSEGSMVKSRQSVIQLRGAAKTLLSVERVCLNIIQRMSGIASMARRMTDKARKGNPKAIVAATRKTTPGFRYFEKRAVVIGGGDSHRYALDDMVLIKNNHIAVVGGVKEAVEAAKAYASYTKKISCEVRSLTEALAAVSAGADIILLDNFEPGDAKSVHDALVNKGLRDQVILEASGGITERNIQVYAEAMVDVLSSGALTHSYKAADFNMGIELEK